MGRSFALTTVGPCAAAVAAIKISTERFDLPAIVLSAMMPAHSRVARLSSGRTRLANYASSSRQQQSSAF